MSRRSRSAPQRPARFADVLAGEKLASADGSPGPRPAAPSPFVPSWRRPGKEYPPRGRLALPRVFVRQRLHRLPAQHPGPLNLALAVDVVGDAEQRRRPPLPRHLSGPALHRIALDEGQSAPLAPLGVLPAPLRHGVQQLRY